MYMELIMVSGVFINAFDKVLNGKRYNSEPFDRKIGKDGNEFIASEEKIYPKGNEANILSQ